VSLENQVIRNKLATLTLKGYLSEGTNS